MACFVQQFLALMELWRITFPEMIKACTKTCWSMVLFCGVFDPVWDEALLLLTPTGVWPIFFFPDSTVHDLFTSNTPGALNTDFRESLGPRRLTIRLINSVNPGSVGQGTQNPQVMPDLYVHI